MDLCFNGLNIFLTKQGLDKHMEFTPMILYFMVGAIAVTIIISLIFSKYKFVKYIPGAALLISGLFMLVSEIPYFLEKSHIMNLFRAGLFISSGLVSLLTSLAIKIYNARVKMKKKRGTVSNNTDNRIKQES